MSWCTGAPYERAPCAPHRDLGEKAKYYLPTSTASNEVGRPFSQRHLDPSVVLHKKETTLFQDRTNGAPAVPSDVTVSVSAPLGDYLHLDWGIGNKGLVKGRLSNKRLNST